LEQQKIMYTEDDLLPLSGLQHLIFCERQCALIHMEQAWVENRLTAEGRIMHERVHSADRESRGDIRVEYGMPFRSLKLGLVGKADVVEFHKKRQEDGEEFWLPFPVEYKRGRPKKDNSDRVQLCAQALCLEEMLALQVSNGALFYGKTRRRLDVAFELSLREETRHAAQRFHELVKEARTPKAVYKKQCDRCSMLDLCLPRTTGKNRSINRYLMEAVQEK
jgi:CRISPR-associated exonuclease Cas4